MKKLMGIIIVWVVFACNEGSEIGNPLTPPDSLREDSAYQIDTSEIKCWSEENGIYELPSTIENKSDIVWEEIKK